MRVRRRETWRRRRRRRALECVYHVRQPLGLFDGVVLVEKALHFFVAADQVELDDERQLFQVNRTQEHGLLEVLFEMARAVHATVQVDAMFHAEQVTGFVHE